MNEQTVRFRLGIFVLLSLILLAVMVILFGGLPGVFNYRTRYEIVFDTAENVGQGTPVKRSGVKIGEVENITLDEETGKVIVTVRIDSQYKLKQSDEPTLVQGLLGSDSAIDFVPPEDGSAKAQDKTPIPPGTRVDGKTTVGVRNVMQKASELVPPAQEALVDIRKTLQRFERMAPLLEQSLKDFSEVTKEMRVAGPELKETNKEFLKLAKAANDTMPSVKASTDELAKLAKAANDYFPELKTTNAEAQKAIVVWSKVGERTNVLLQANEEKLTSIIKSLEESLVGVRDLLSEDNRKSITEIIANTNKASKKFPDLAKNADDLLKKTGPAIDKLNDAITRADKIMQDLEKVTKPLSERSEKILANLDEATGELNKAMGDLRTLVLAASRSDGTVQKLLSDPALYNRLDEAAALLTKVAPRLENILRDVEIFADRIARHPESLGIGGVVNPGSGLKELPRQPLWKTGP